MTETIETKWNGEKVTRNLTLVAGENIAISFKGTKFENGFYVDQFTDAWSLKKKPLTCLIHPRTQMRWSRERWGGFFCSKCLFETGEG